MYFEIYKETKKLPFNGGIKETGKWRWRARAQNGNILADSGQGYSGGRSAIIKRVRKFVQYFRDNSYLKIRDLSCGEEINL